MDAVILVNEGYQVLLFNLAAEQVFGYRAEEIIGQPLDRLIPERFRQDHQTHVKGYAEKEYTKRMHGALGEIVGVRANGEEFLAEASLAQAMAGKEKILAVFLRDISMRKKVEADLQLFRQLIDQSNDAIEILDLETGYFLDVNAKACADLGYSHAEYLSLSVFDIDPMINQSTFAATIGKLKESGTLLWEGLHKRKDGSTFPVEVSLSNVQLDREYIVSVARDITNRKRLQEARGLAEERYSKLFRNMLNGFAFCQMLFDENNQPIDFIYLEVNSAFENLTGLKNVDGKKVSEVIPGIKESNPELFEIYGRVALNGTPEKFESFVDPLKIWFLISVYCPEKGFFVAVFDNISESKKMEKDIRDREERYRSLYETAQKRLSQTMALRDIDKAISTNLDLKSTLEIVLTQVMNELQVDAADILLYDADAQMLRFFAGKGFRTSVVEGFRVPLGSGFASRAILERKRIDVSDLREEAVDSVLRPDLAVEGFVDYHVVPLIAKGKALGALGIFKRSSFAAGPEWLDYFETLAGQAAIAIDNITLFEGLQNANDQLVLGYDATIEGWSRVLDLRDKETEGHTQRVASLTISLAKKMGVKDEELVHMRRGSLLHDIGKMAVPDSILLKPGKLTDEEWVIMKKHPQHAYDMLSPILYLRDALDIPYYHHEKWNGSGYPTGLKGEAIPFAARIFAVTDVYDALISDRPYRKAWSKKKALDYIKEQAGTHFDPYAVKTFLEKEIAKH
jgi:PAS domain S-box-containing protein/putative nucleotidyltransferase with HDIG domain